ncbi:molybdenum cofactor biosynthesis protein C [Alkalihalobacillus alcalophilus ATCC 27647 = CGMCC 1.3604]|uniref:Cyclic pyranopterin monophosphate synthase n=1 Tax=Alkalihalobacillus alcalophilus ATCC 27647 = CGMCC 1.3604 TaxID=1218173 RepID=A0A4S4K3C3_ALKAL|nr:cyclic pyranopterin monophosphate synthase MoaC [Alkalihalobacillus alcalophilus]MED1561388.1 cyclic pyranopterin monophosphate synthase MoaC [Alkalihalobacillus alcalophilus]THG92186.1 molybdenum cofactor biosynthesis protein C [Alkalihalobacillus alcalophilus ATCC 27647 = CGMCC 1.3604]
MDKLTHFNEQGRAKMVDISDKNITIRTALAKSSIDVSPEIHEKIEQGKIGKGDVLAVAQVAGIMAAKNTSHWIPMCHPLSLNGVNIEFSWEKNDHDATLHISVEVKTEGKTGVEMEALTAASATALTVYDMCKALDKGMVIGPTFLVKKSGGKNGDFER